MTATRSSRRSTRGAWRRETYRASRRKLTGALPERSDHMCIRSSGHHSSPLGCDPEPVIWHGPLASENVASVLRGARQSRLEPAPTHSVK